MKRFRYFPVVLATILLGACGQDFVIEEPELTMAITSPETVRLGQSIDLSVDWNFPSYGYSVQWLASNANILITDPLYSSYSRNEKKRAIGKKVGTATVTAMLNGRQCSKEITVEHIAEFYVEHNGLKVTFRPVASIYSNDYDSFTWNFGDDSAPHSTYFNVVHTYSAPGTYNVSLTLYKSSTSTYGYGSDTVTKTITVTY